MDAVELNKKMFIWPQICHELFDKYDVVDAVGLPRWDFDMQALKQKLSQYRSHEFATNQRLIFSLYDTEYYPIGSNIGFNIYNLILLLTDLDISLPHCQLWTNHHGITSTVNSLCASLGYNYPIQVFENNFTDLLSTRNPDVIHGLSRSASDLLFHFSFLGYQFRNHRKYMRLFLQQDHVFSKTLISWNGDNVSHDWRPTALPEVLQQIDNRSLAVEPSYFLKIEPFVRIRDHLPVDSDINELYKQYKHVLNVSVCHPLINSTANSNNFNLPFQKYCFLDIAAETVFDYPYPYLSEKTFRCLWQLQPFVIVGAANSLAYLKNIGFKTFDSWWDESYDQLSNPMDRLKACFNIINTVSKWSLSQCQDVYNQMLDVLVHNRNHYKNHYCKQMLSDTLNSIDL
jgi:hypothetical protein